MTMEISKQDALATLDRELARRVAALRTTYEHMCQSMLARTEIHISRMPKSKREMKMKDVLQLSSKDRVNRQRLESSVDLTTGQSEAGSGGVKRKAVASPMKSSSKVVKKGRVEKVSQTSEVKKVISRRANSKKGD